MTENDGGRYEAERPVPPQPAAPPSSAAAERDSGTNGAQPAPGYGQQTSPTARIEGPRDETHHDGTHPTAPIGQPQPPQYGQRQAPQYGQQAYGQHSYGTGSYLPPAVTATSARERRRFGVPTLVAGMILAALVGGGAAAGTNALLDGEGTSAVSSSSQPAQVIVNNKDSVNAISAAAQKASPSVVTIGVTSGNSAGTGSGIILDNQGHILTNTHVVTLDGKVAKPSIEVRTNDGKVYQATVVGTDPLSDLAVVKIDAPNLTPATLGDSSKINVGDTTIAIGAPLGLTGTVTDGIVSTLNRTISVASSAAPANPNGDSSQGNGQGNGQDNGGGGFSFAPPDGSQGNSSANQGSISINVIQTDAAINPGNSGGALVNTKGEIIGINVAIASAGGSSSTGGQSGNIGVGFSIPIDNAKRIAQEIIANGSATHGQLGVSVAPKAASSSSQFSVGAEVAQVVSGSAADKAGIQKGDVITKLGDRPVQDAEELTAAVREQAAGANVKLTLLRGGKQQQVDVTLGAAAKS
ncbi:trypsin-like peptidase domain-containing protein [Paenarthrobacter sp. DKR-5]|uniref:S1C family serine protease n=1 Tax=Paenarthrobacter sp. DKR-5 TaxID=2835535 RepID=UPI001BDC1BCB|nr:trypsin-like peptidase domain-containing protein [Paenarthrobacter sp. DKR-5]MBT1002974.1 trypsin-like peptidase domain-containing protein [Paenarthrobacter sp. DKR-5]